MSMIIITFLLLVITCILAIYPLFSSEKKPYSLKDISRNLYEKNEKDLQRSLHEKEITEEEYEHQHTEAARQFIRLTDAKKDRLTNGIKGFVIVLIFLIPAITAVLYWRFDYTPEAQSFDYERKTLSPLLDEWVTLIPERELDTIQDFSQIKPEPSDAIKQKFQYTFPLLTLLSAERSHNDQKLLKLLARMYYDVNMFETAYEIYDRITHNDPSDFIGRYMKLDIELMANKNVISPKIAASFKALIHDYPEMPILQMQFSQLLYENGQQEESLAQWENLKRYYQAKHDEKGIGLVDEVIMMIQEKSLETSTLRNIDVTLQQGDADLKEIPQDALISIYLMDFEDKVPVAFVEVPLTAFPMKIKLNDFNRFETVTTPIKNFEHLAIFADIHSPKSDKPIYSTPLIEIPKGAYESSLGFEATPSSSSENEATQLMQKTVSLAKEVAKNQFYFTLTLGEEIDLSTLPESATLYVFLNLPNSTMPIAAKQIVNAKSLKFPYTLMLSNEDLIVPNAPELKTYDQLVAKARISRTNESVGLENDIESEGVSVSQTHKSGTLHLDKIRTTSRPIPQL